MGRVEADDHIRPDKVVGSHSTTESRQIILDLQGRPDQPFLQWWKDFERD